MAAGAAAPPRRAVALDVGFSFETPDATEVGALGGAYVAVAGAGRGCEVLVVAGLEGKTTGLAGDRVVGVTVTGFCEGVAATVFVDAAVA